MTLRVLGGRFDCCGRAHCARETGLPMWRLPDGTESTVCPVRLVTQEDVEMLDWHAHYRQRLLPVAGGLLDQSALYVDAMRAIDEAERRAAAEARREQAARQARLSALSGRAPRRG